MKTSPSFSFYASDFILGTMLMSAEEVGAYIRLLCWQWEQGELPSDLEKLSRICGVSQKKLSGVLVKFRVTESGGYINNRLEEVREQREHFIEIQRLNGKKGGRPKKAMENPRVINGLTQSEPKKTLPSPSPSPLIPPSPPEGDGEELKLSIEDDTPPPSKPWNPTPEQIEVASWFSRRPTTRWSRDEVSLWKKLQPIAPDDWEAAKWYYSESGCPFLRKDLKTLLNNWNGEVDRAKNYDPERDKRR